MRNAVRALAISALALTLAVWAISYAHPKPRLLGRAEFSLTDGALLFRASQRGMNVLYDGTHHALRTIWWTDASFVAARITRTTPAGPVNNNLYALPLWIPSLLAASLFFAARTARYGPGRCRACGYDLTASPGPCPECGAPGSSGPRAEAPPAAPSVTSTRAGTS